MTTTIVPAVSTPRSLPRRLANVARLHLANPFALIVTPLLVLGVIFVANVVIWALIRFASPDDPESVAAVSQGLQYSGASLWTFVYMMVVAIQAMNLSFPFALGFGSTRRDFALGTAVTFVGMSAAWAVLYTAFAIIENATNGWGLGGVLFDSFFFGIDVSWGERLFNVFAAFVFFFAIGSMFGAIYVRYRGRGLILFFLALALVTVGLVALITLASGWPAIGKFFVTVGFAGGYALSLAVSLVAGTTGHLILRRATPRS